ncbi:hypothetical protein M422DRAFT_190478 [Sphaerobolus stellatus SS14]|uniref:M-phase inducer phosphatase n=1 Tax=Sphaerobolus stellatus (strain SS14) TaxID=990650 RepID=A0A0C9TEX9_SPHS4|nr:hypothetical protein M422DRAFT_190478 [Sphaerobolus stellatus SS14]
MIAHSNAIEPSSDDFSDGQSSSPAASAYAKRHQVRVIRRCDGSEDLRPLNGAGSLEKRDRNNFQEKGCSPRSLAGFGVHEVEKKILPCHRVSDDGLVRITPSTLRDLLEGSYNSKINSCTIVDCRFDYEYIGGHIPGAINLNTTAALDDYFLGDNKPEPSESGDAAARNIVVFHCEFSMKRAPTFAKHVRARDRAINGRFYPKVCYPELYILEGGYSQFYKEFSTHCDPQGYVQMDDPAHLHARNEELNNFRKGKWGRTQSYTYGQSTSGLSSFSVVPANENAPIPARENRKTAPSGGPGGSGSMFAAANAARGRRTNTTTNPPMALNGLSTLDEDASSSACEEGDSLDLGDSPCPPPSKNGGRMSLLGSSKPLSLSVRVGLDRAASYGPSRR